MGLIAWLKNNPKPKKDEQFILTDKAAEDLQKAVADVEAPPPVVPKGKVTRTTGKLEYNPRTQRHGGRIVKTMPRELVKIKEAQEKLEDDTE